MNLKCFTELKLDESQNERIRGESVFVIVVVFTIGGFSDRNQVYFARAL